MPLTDSAVVVAQYVFDMVEYNKAALGIEAVFYGDQSKYPVTPAAAVEPAIKRRVLVGAPRRSENTLQVFVMVYVGRIGDNQINTKDADTIAEAVEALIHTDPTLGGLVVNSMVESIEPGYANRGAVMRASRLTLTALSKTQLPMPQ